MAIQAVPAAVAQAGDPRKLGKKAAEQRRAGRFDDAEESLRQALKSDPKRPETKLELAYVLTKQRRLLDAYNIVYPIVEADPKNSRALAVLGMTLLAGGRFKEARGILFRALQLNRRDHLAWHGYGLLEFYENNIKESVANLREAVFFQDFEPDYVFALAQVSARDEKYSEAADAYERFLEISKAGDSDRRDRIKGLIGFLRFLGNNKTLYRTAGSSQTTVPFELVGNRPIINVRINDKKETLRFVLDTGSGISVLSDETAKRLKIKPIIRGGFARGLGGTGKFEIVYGFLNRFDIGEVSMRDVPIYIRKFHNDATRVDGYIGLGLISKFLTTVDYGTKTFSLVKKDAATPDTASSELSLPLRLTSSGFLSGEVELQGVDVPLNFIVDTGASVSVISDRVASDEQVSQFVGDEKLRVIGSAGVTEEVRTFVLPRVTFGKNTRTDVTAVALDLDIINEASGFEQSGILGGNFLKNYRLTFDFKNSRVTFVSVLPEHD
jgi:cytochrome c-type biogenesis protein CcmH/NrfG/predicted aspartyl protease